MGRPKRLYFYPRSPCGERRCWKLAARDESMISIHALLAESDGNHAAQLDPVCNFYPRSPCGERQRPYYPQSRPRLFLSTLSLRRATANSGPCNGRLLHFYPRSPCGERQHGRGPRQCSFCHFYPRSPCGERRIAGPVPRSGHIISIHALLAESDQIHSCSRPSQQSISIHALLAESDVLVLGIPTSVSNFYPRSPCGERLLLIWAARILPLFLSTLSLRRATKAQDRYKDTVTISIHALLAESDVRRSTMADFDKIFLSTLSLRRATYLGRGQRPNLRISIHALLAESDCLFCVKLQLPLIFLSTLSLRRATLKPPVKSHAKKHFYPRSPCGERRIAGPVPRSGHIISIHALLAESDTLQNFINPLKNDFYPRSPCGERPVNMRITQSPVNFYPRSPCGERLY